VVEGMFVDITYLLHSVSLEKHTVVNFKPSPLSFSRKMQISGNYLVSRTSSRRLTHMRPFLSPFSSGTLHAVLV
jgi:hypothetical protein